MLTNAQGQLDPNSKFMVFMIDTDVVQNNVSTTLLHWFQPNLQMTTSSTPAAAAGNATAAFTSQMVTLAVNNGAAAAPVPGAPAPAPNANTNVQTAYLGPSPPPGPPHRYVQVLFFQPSNFSVPACFQNILTQPGQAPNSNTAMRVGFDINQFLAAANLPAAPIAGNFFRAQNPQPGSLTVSATASALVNAMCPGVNAIGAGAPPMAAMGMGGMAPAAGMGAGAVPAAPAPGSAPGAAPMGVQIVRARASIDNDYN